MSHMYRDVDDLSATASLIDSGGTELRYISILKPTVRRQSSLVSAWLRQEWEKGGGRFCLSERFQKGLFREGISRIGRAMMIFGGRFSVLTGEDKHDPAEKAENIVGQLQRAVSCGWKQ